jgi:hypothetical protein
MPPFICVDSPGFELFFSFRARRLEHVEKENKELLERLETQNSELLATRQVRHNKNEQLEEQKYPVDFLHFIF